MSRQRKTHKQFVYHDLLKLPFNSSSIIRTLWYLNGPSRYSVQYEPIESMTSLCFGRLQCHRNIILCSLHPHFLSQSSCGFNNPLSGSSQTSMDVKPDGLRSSRVPLSGGSFISMCQTQRLNSSFTRQSMSQSMLDPSSLPRAFLGDLHL